MQRSHRARWFPYNKWHKVLDEDIVKAVDIEVEHGKVLWTQSLAMWWATCSTSV